MKIAIYSCNFGNYRNEFDHYYNVIFDKQIDYFLFTDRNLSEKEIAKLDKWKVCNIPLVPADDIMNETRWTSKYVKFILPEQLTGYDVTVWIDNKRFIKNDKMNKITYEQITNIINKCPNYDIFNLKHPWSKGVQREISETIRLKLENIEHANIFAEKMKNYVSQFHLVETCVIIRKNNKAVNDVFAYCIKLLKEHKLKRDQNIYNLALDTHHIIPKLLHYDDLCILP